MQTIKVTYVDGITNFNSVTEERQSRMGYFQIYIKKITPKLNLSEKS